MLRSWKERQRWAIPTAAFHSTDLPAPSGEGKRQGKEQATEVIKLLSEELEQLQPGGWTLGTQGHDSPYVAICTRGVFEQPLQKQPLQRKEVWMKRKRSLLISFLLTVFKPIKEFLFKCGSAVCL